MKSKKAIDTLIQGVIRTQNPTVLGLDTAYEYLQAPPALGEDYQEQAAEAIFAYNKGLIDGLCDIIPAVKVQIAYYEMYGLYGMQAFAKTLQYAQHCGMVVMSDAKRGDIGATAKCYSTAFIGRPTIDNRPCDAFSSDFVTVNPYFGIDGIQPFLDDCAQNARGIFVLVKTSNPSGGQFQDLLSDGKPVFEHVGEQVMQWGASLVGEYGYSEIGAVVGATYPAQGSALRKKLSCVYFLVPGYGAQGAKGADLAGCFDQNGNGAIVNASRSIICAHKKAPGVQYVDAARAEALRMKADLLSALKEIK